MAKQYDFFKTSGMRGDLEEMLDGMTRQEFAEECDINTIMAKYEAGGAVSHVNAQKPVYLDCTLYPGLQAHMDAFREASASFAALPAKVRREFDNDPQQFVDFACDPENIERLREWGLAAPVAPPPGAVKVEIVAGEVPVAGGEKPPAGKSAAS
ncbi:MAG: internal scaffolding protein [Microviridae sp.]|nr:MAG: internal scaffolding protein [Microviridae sp.]